MGKRVHNEKFSKGDRVTHSTRGLERLKPRHPERAATVVGFSHGFGIAVRVHWDGTAPATVDVLHQDYLQLAP